MWEKVAFLNILWFEYKSTVLKCQVSALKIQFSSKNQLFYFIRYFKNSIYSKFWRFLKANPTQNASVGIEVCATFYSNLRTTPCLVIVKRKFRISTHFILWITKKKKNWEFFLWFFFSWNRFFRTQTGCLMCILMKKMIWYNFRPHQNLAILEHYHCALVCVRSSY